VTVVLVHGNPEVAEIWGAMLAELDRDDGMAHDIVALSPPGFGGAVPDGFGSTSDEYAEWLVGELQHFDDPVHLIGHDWGGGHVVRATILRPDLVSTVTTDIAGCFAPGYEWHDMARVWRTEGAGEDTVAAMATVALPERADMFEGLGMNRRAAEACAAAATEMGPHILSLYRSAPESAFEAWSDQMAALERGPAIHVVIATEDHYTGGVEKATHTAERWGATIHRLDGLGHWWMMEDPKRAAAVVRSITT
jgi:pimeloyl-ACP methyl ester carboxylesterase